MRLWLRGLQHVLQLIGTLRGSRFLKPRSTPNLRLLTRASFIRHLSGFARIWREPEVSFVLFLTLQVGLFA